MWHEKKQKTKKKIRNLVKLTVHGDKLKQENWNEMGTAQDMIPKWRTPLASEQPNPFLYLTLYLDGRCWRAACQPVIPFMGHFSLMEVLRWGWFRGSITTTTDGVGHVHSCSLGVQSWNFPQVFWFINSWSFILTQSTVIITNSWIIIYTNQFIHSLIICTLACL